MAQKTLSAVNKNVGRTYQRGFNTLRIATQPTDGDTVTIGSTVFTFKTSPTGSQVAIGASATTATANLTAAINTANIGVTATNISANEILVEDVVGAPPGIVGNASASGVLTSSANYANGETVTIGSVVYTFVTTLQTNVVGQILIGASEAASIQNLTDAINGAGTPGLTYSNKNVANPKVTAVAATHTCTVTARRAGTGQNAVATTETSGTASWGSATLTGGTDTAYFSETMAGTNNAWAGAQFAGYVAISKPGFIPSTTVASRVPNAQEIALKSMHFLFGFTVRSFIVQHRDSTGALKAFDGTVNLSGKRVTVAGGTSVLLATSDLVTVSASE